VAERVLLALLLSTLVFGVATADVMERAYRAYSDGDYERAHGLWLQRAEQGDMAAQINLGALYERGLGVERDQARALEWYRRAAEGGDADAQYQVGLMHELGLGVESDIHEAEHWYQRAIDQGYCPGELGDAAEIRR
jgi:TPR repeat protein